MLNVGGHSCQFFYCFFLIISECNFAFISVYVDDILLATTSVELKASIVAKLFDRFNITDEGEFTWSLGMHVHTSPDRHTIQIDMEKYTRDIISRFNFDHLTTSSVPMQPSTRFSSADCPTSAAEVTVMLQYPFRPALGAILFLMIVFRMDISFPTISLSRFASNPSLAMWHSLTLIYRYLKGTVGIKLTYSRQSDNRNPLLVGFTDSDWAADIDNRKSTGAYLFLLDGASCSWKVKHSPTVCLSTQQAEYYALSEGTKEALNLRFLLRDLGFGQTLPTMLFCDNKDAITMALHPANKPASRHIDMRIHFCRQNV